ncbi:hypothetical protein SELMODRAFT_422342 [Selaginella moellendorffii]|uniref:Uncharacterized protein n=1 Tax=Selaginella moellendorffii TaxID=88036 RepID=D8SI38_SELML|nr:hypothetical protein SELMODRAFT_422342 [Selaginella moellendorffii]
MGLSYSQRGNLPAQWSAIAWFLSFEEHFFAQESKWQDHLLKIHELRFCWVFSVLCVKAWTQYVPNSGLCALAEEASAYAGETADDFFSVMELLNSRYRNDRIAGSPQHDSHLVSGVYVPIPIVASKRDKRMKCTPVTARRSKDGNRRGGLRVDPRQKSQQARAISVATSCENGRTPPSVEMCFQGGSYKGRSGGGQLEMNEVDGRSSTTEIGSKARAIRFTMQMATSTKVSCMERQGIFVAPSISQVFHQPHHSEVSIVKVSGDTKTHS